MHELTLAVAVIDLIMEEAERHHAGTVSQVDIEVGTLSGVDGAALEFALSLAVKDTSLASVAFRLVHTPGEGECSSCGGTFSMDEPWTPCPVCRKPAAKILRGDGLRILSLTVDE